MAEERLHKLVNGEKIYLTEEEEKATRDEWARNDEKRKQRRIQAAELKNKKEAALENLFQNVSPQDKELLKEMLMK